MHAVVVLYNKSSHPCNITIRSLSGI